MMLSCNPLSPSHEMHAGLIGGILLCVIIALAEASTLCVLSKFAERYAAPTYGTLVRRTLGRKLTACMSIIMVLFLFGACILYQIIIADTVTSLSAHWMGPGSPLTDRAAVILASGFGLILPLCCTRQVTPHHFDVFLHILQWRSAVQAC